MRTGVTTAPNHQNTGFKFNDRSSTTEYAKVTSPYFAKATKGKKVHDHKVNCVAQGSAQENGHISTSRLNRLPDFHLTPINLIICKVSRNDY